MPRKAGGRATGRSKARRRTSARRASRNAMERLRESEARYRSMFETMPSGVAVYRVVGDGDDFVFEDFNSAAERISRIGRDEVIGRSLLELFPNMDRFGLFAALQRVHRTGQPEHLQPAFYVDSRREGWRENRIYRLPSKRVVAIYDDVTERMRAEERARSSQERFDALFRSSREMVYIHDFGGRFVEANDQALLALGYTRDEIRDVRFQDLLDEEDVARAVGRSRELLETRTQRGVDTYRLRTNDGRTIWVETTGTRLDRNGEPFGVLGIARDVTERRLLEAELLQAQKLEAIGTLAGGMAHDMNNVLAVVLTLSSLLEQEMGPDDPRAKDVADMSAAARRGKELVESLLRFARKGTYHPERFRPNESIEGLVEVLRRTIPKRIDVGADLDPALQAVEADPSQVQQAMMNVCLNAADAISGTGKITVRARNLSLEASDVTASLDLRPGRWVRIDVVDDGEGMDEETVKRAFEPFFTTKDVGRGTGLGLSTAYGVVKACGGAVDIRSSPGEGTTVSIFLPAAEQIPVDHTTPPRRGLGRGKGTVLVVDDEEMVRRAGQRLLESLGYSAVLAEDGRTACDLFERRRGEVDLVLLDLSMPGMDGVECLERLRAIDPDVRVLVWTGHSSGRSADEVVGRGATGVLTKPLDAEQFAAAIAAAFESGASTEAPDRRTRRVRR